ncbi:MAG: hypothetical protein HOV82_14275 [Streptomyces sp.]|nr:hypothetical protein [Streptomyces sp.]
MTERGAGPSAARIAVTGGSVAATLLLMTAFANAQHAADAERARQDRQQVAARQQAQSAAQPSRTVKIVTVVRRHTGTTPTGGGAAAPQAPAAAARPAPARAAAPAPAPAAPAPATNSRAS